MATEIRKHQTLIELESLINRLLAKQTNLAFANNMKFSYKMSWTKGEKQIFNGVNKIKDYYILRVYIIDKTELITKEITLFNNVYPVIAGSTSPKLQEEALQQYLLHCISSQAYIELVKYKENENNQEVDKLVNEKLQETESPIIQIERPGLIL